MLDTLGCGRSLGGIRVCDKANSCDRLKTFNLVLVLSAQSYIVLAKVAATVAATIAPCIPLVADYQPSSSKLPEMTLAKIARVSAAGSQYFNAAINKHRLLQPNSKNLHRMQTKQIDESSNRRHEQTNERITF